MLRGLVIAMGALLLAGALFVLAAGAGGAAVALSMFGAVLLLGTLFERRRYRAIAAEPPGEGWERTAERFRDPTGGGPVEVWFNPATGQRRYVRAGPGAPLPDR
ncbi:MAG: hypothetical protein KGL52_03450 [Rhodospirillales bacterium]|nr:hypothetical protein [Rhodospirillales bacterium]